MNGEESVRVADRIATNLRGLGHDVRIIEYWDRDYDDPDLPSRRINIPIQPLAAGGFNALPCLTRQQYIAACGDDIDFASVVQHSVTGEFWASDGAIMQSRLDPESYYHGRLRGLAHKVEGIYGAVQPHLVVIGHGSEAVSRILVAKALKAGIPLLTSESSFFPGFVALDPCGPHFIPSHNQIDADWNTIAKTALTGEQERWASSFVSSWKASCTSKYPQPSAAREERAVAEFLRRDGRPSLFVPMQVPADASVYFGLGDLPNLDAFYLRLIDQLAPRFKLIFKRHPKAAEAKFVPRMPSADGLVVDKVSIHFLIQHTTATLTFSSNVGLEALMYEKPVIVGGKPYYHGRGLTLDFECVCRSEDPVATVTNFRQPAGLLHQLLCYLCQRYLIPDDDARRLSLRILDSSLAEYELRTDPRRPFHDDAPKVGQDLYSLITTGFALARENKSINDMLDRAHFPAGLRTIAEDPGDLCDENPPPTPWLHELDPRHLAPYAFAATLLPEGAQVLDLSCGTGYGAYMMVSRSACRVDAIDASLARIRYARENWSHPRIRHTAATAGGYLERIDGPEYDCVISLAPAGRIANPAMLLFQAWKAVKAGGRLVIFTDGTPADGTTSHSIAPNEGAGMSLEVLAEGLPDLDSIELFEQAGLAISKVAGHRGHTALCVMTRAGTRTAPQAARLRATDGFEFRTVPRHPTTLSGLAQAAVALRLSEFVLLADALDRRRLNLRNQLGIVGLALTGIFMLVFGNRLVKRLFIRPHWRDPGTS